MTDEEDRRSIRARLRFFYERRACIYLKLNFCYTRTRSTTTTREDIYIKWNKGNNRRRAGTRTEAPRARWKHADGVSEVHRSAVKTATGLRT